MPKFTQQDVKEMEVANQIKSVLSSAHLNLGVEQPEVITASYNFTTGDLEYELTTAGTTTKKASSSS